MDTDQAMLAPDHQPCRNDVVLVPRGAPDLIGRALLAPGIQDEAERLGATLASGLLETPDHAGFDRLVRLAGHMLGAPIAAFTLLARDRQWLRARIGIDTREMPREWAFCNDTVLGDGVFCVEDASRDPRFCANPLVTGPDNIRFYAGVSVHERHGYRIGTLCVLDREPRRLSAAQELALTTLAHLLSEEIARYCTQVAWGIRPRPVP